VKSRRRGKFENLSQEKSLLADDDNKKKTYTSTMKPSSEFNFTFSWYPRITYYWTGFLILDHSYLVGNLTNSKIAETKVLEPLKS
jgi:tagatose-1,6-bisphosphate aldolase non-catalytic subunit AgaZ/GatZ